MKLKWKKNRRGKKSRQPNGWCSNWHGWAMRSQRDRLHAVIASTFGPNVAIHICGTHLYRCLNAHIKRSYSYATGNGFLGANPAKLAPSATTILLIYSSFFHPVLSMNFFGWHSHRLCTPLLFRAFSHKTGRIYLLSCKQPDLPKTHYGKWWLAFGMFATLIAHMPVPVHVKPYAMHTHNVYNIYIAHIVCNQPMRYEMDAARWGTISPATIKQQVTEFTHVCSAKYGKLSSW